jgi:hypothetical protein
VGGYFAAKMRRYQDLIENRLQPEMQQVITRIQDKSLDMSNDSLMQKTMPVINMMNTRYLKFGDKSGRDVLLNPNAQGAAWFVEEIKAVKTPDESMAALAQEDLKRIAVVNSTDFNLAPSRFSVDSAAQITLKEYEPNRLLYTYKNNNPGFAVFSEVYYPHGWEVLLDGEPLEGLVRVNYTLRGLKLPAGEHKLEFRFNSASFEQGNTLTELSSHLVLLVLVLALGFSVWKAFRQPADDVK